MKYFLALVAMALLYCQAVRAADYVISGIVSSGEPPVTTPGVNIRVFSSFFPPDTVVAQAVSDDQGRYDLAFSCSECWINAVLPGHHSFNVYLSQVPVTHTIDIALVPFSGIAGTVRRAADGQPVDGANVTLETFADSSASYSISEYAFTGTDGSYAFERLYRGRYRVCANQWSGTLRTQCFDRHDRPALMSAQQYSAIDLATGQQRNSTDFALASGASLRGRIIDQYSQQPVAATVTVHDTEGRAVLRAFSDVTTGNYQSAGLAPGSYYVKATTSFGIGALEAWPSASLYGGQPCNGTCDPASGQVVVVGAAPLAGIDIAIRPRALLHGIMRDAVTNAPVAHVPVEASWPMGIMPELGHVASTAEDGSFTLYVAPGQSQLHIGAADDNRYIAMRWPDVLCWASCVGLGHAIAVADNSEQGGFELRRVRGGVISGRVHGGGVGVPAAVVSLYDAATGELVTDTMSNFFGLYILPRWLDGNYHLMATSDGACEVYAGRPCPAPGLPLSSVQPDAVAIAQGGSIDHVDFHFNGVANAIFDDGFDVTTP